MKPLACAKAPCASCPYRKDVPSGVWEAHEYAKLLAYDEPTWGQPPALFMCHQADGKLCAGWVGTHGTDLLAMRLAAARGDLHPDAWSYESPVPLFASGAEAAEHGLRDMASLTPEANRTITKLLKQRQRKRRA